MIPSGRVGLHDVNVLVPGVIVSELVEDDEPTGQARLAGFLLAVAIGVFENDAFKRRLVNVIEGEPSLVCPRADTGRPGVGAVGAIGIGGVLAVGKQFTDRVVSWLEAGDGKVPVHVGDRRGLACLPPAVVVEVDVDERPRLRREE